MKLQHQGFNLTPEAYLHREQPDAPIYFLDISKLENTLVQFKTGFQGMTTYAVKANPNPLVLQTLIDAGIEGFDVASVQEMQAVRALSSQVRLHYHNPLRSMREIEIAKQFDISSWSVDSVKELTKLGALPKGTEVAVRLKLQTKGGAYNFGEKFGATETDAIEILKYVVECGFEPAMTFHPGTQCEVASVWSDYIHACARVAKAAGIALKTLNVGGGFAAFRSSAAPEIVSVFDTIHQAVDDAFPHGRPRLVCEPGRAMVADAVAVALQVKVIRENGDVILNDGMYGALGEWRDIPKLADRHLALHDIAGELKFGPKHARKVYGPTCDSIDCLPFALELPDTIIEGDYLVIQSMGAYSQSLCTSFNGYGGGEMVVCERITPADTGLVEICN